MRDNI